MVEEFYLEFQVRQDNDNDFYFEPFFDPFSYCITVQFEAVRGHCVEYAEMLGWHNLNICLSRAARILYRSS